MPTPQERYLAFLQSGIGAGSDEVLQGARESDPGMVWQDFNTGAGTEGGSGVNEKRLVHDPLYAQLVEARKTDPGAIIQENKTGYGTEGGGSSSTREIIHDPAYDNNKKVYDKYPLAQFLKAQWIGNSGEGVNLRSDQYQDFGGDMMLDAVKKYDPNAKWSDLANEYAGEGGGMTGGGKHLDVDYSKLPGSKYNFGDDRMRPAGGRMMNEKAIYEDPNYGWVMGSKNFRKAAGEWWEYAAPLLVGAVAPMAGAALYGAGIGAGVGSGIAGGAGATSAVTGGAAGLGASNIPGATAAAAGGGIGAGEVAATAPGYVTQGVKGGPGMIDAMKRGDYTAMLPLLLSAAGVDPTAAAAIKGGVNVAQGKDFDVTAYLPMIAQQMGIDPALVKGAGTGITLAKLAQAYNKRRG